MPAADGSAGGAFKDRISAEAVEEIAADLSWAWPEFPRAEFVREAVDGLDELELKARVTHVADSLAAAMPSDFRKAVPVIDRAVERPSFDGWIVFAVNDWVARYGIEEPDAALPLLGRLTPRWTAEYAIRPFIEAHRKRTFEEFDRWIESGDEHRRRLVSEGSRPRLPWSFHLRAFIEDPSPTIPLLDRLVDDPSVYVRKSVANHLNDIAKDHSELAIEVASRWRQEDPASDRRRWVASHGLRTLIKSGDEDALRLLGYDPEAPVSLSAFRISPDEIRIGEAVEIEFTLTVPESTPVMVDYAIHHAGAEGRRSPKVFKLKRTELKPETGTKFHRRHRIRQVSIRKIYPGAHLIEVQVNGRVLAAATIQVTAA